MKAIVYRTVNEEKAMEMAEYFGGTVKERNVYDVTDYRCTTMYEVEVEKEEESN